MHRNTSLLFVRCATLLMISMCACSGPWQDVFSDHPHITISRTLCRMLCAFSKFQPCAPPTRSGKCDLSISSKDTLFLCKSCKSLTVTFHSLLIMFHSRASTSTSAISLLGSTTGGTLNRGEFLSFDASQIFWFNSYT